MPAPLLEMSRLGAAATALLLGGSAILSASAATAPGRQVSSSIPNTQGAVVGWHIKDGTIYGADLAPGMIPWFTNTYDNTVWSVSIVDGAVAERDLNSAVKSKLNETTGQVTKVESDGPYPGSTRLQENPGNGANSTEKVPADGKSHAVWVQCADAKTALGGGFRLGADQGDAVASKIQVVASEPTQIKEGKVDYQPIAGDAAGSFEPNGWLVEVINSGTTDATVRPWVTCAKVAK